MKSHLEVIFQIIRVSEKGELERSAALSIRGFRSRKQDVKEGSSWDFSVHDVHP